MNCGVASRRKLRVFTLITYYQLSAIGYRLSAIGYRLSAIGYRLSAIGYRLSNMFSLTNHKTIDDTGYSSQPGLRYSHDKDHIGNLSRFMTTTVVWLPRTPSRDFTPLTSIKNHQLIRTMKKQHKKTEISIVRALNKVCESLKNEDVGFSWLTHFVDYTSFHQSLKFVFVFETNTDLEEAKCKALYTYIYELTDTALKVQGISIKHRDNLLLFDSEENGANVESSQWCGKYA